MKTKRKVITYMGKILDKNGCPNQLHIYLILESQIESPKQTRRADIIPFDESCPIPDENLFTGQMEGDAMSLAEDALNRLKGLRGLIRREINRFDSGLFVKKRKNLALEGKSQQKPDSPTNARKEKLRRLTKNLRKTNPKLADAIEKFCGEMKSYYEVDTEFRDLLKLFPGNSFSDVSIKMAKAAGLKK
jgi:hypothetical protein